MDICKVREKFGSNVGRGDQVDICKIVFLVSIFQYVLQMTFWVDVKVWIIGYLSICMMGIVPSAQGCLHDPHISHWSMMYHGLYNLSVQTIGSLAYYDDSDWQLVSASVLTQNANAYAHLCQRHMQWSLTFAEYTAKHLVYTFVVNIALGIFMTHKQFVHFFITQLFT